MLDLPDELIEIILDYLPVKDLLNALIVSKTWLKYIGKSASFRKRIALNSNFYTNSSISKRRKYETLMIRHFLANKDITELIRNNEWRNVFFNIQRVESQKKFVSIIKKLKTVRELKVMNVAITKLNKHDKISLPELKHLVLSDVAVDTFETFMNKQPSLKSLSLRYLTCDILNPRTVADYIVEFLLKNSHIISLELYPDVVANLFKNEDILQVPLKLRDLALNFSDINDSANQKNIEGFIKSQSSLEELRIIFRSKHSDSRGRYMRECSFARNMFFEEDPRAREITKCDDLMILFNVWNSLSNLKKLTLRFMTNFAETEAYPSMFKSHKSNTTIKILNVQHFGNKIPVKLILRVMALCPNLSTLYISTLNSDVIKFCAENLKLLKTIGFTEEKDDATVEYNAMISSENCNLNKFIHFRKENRG